MWLGTIDDTKEGWMSRRKPVDDVKELLNDSNLFEHKLHFPIHVLKQTAKVELNKLKIWPLESHMDG